MSNSVMGDDSCRWGYVAAVKNVGIVMIILIVLSMIGSLITGGLFKALAGGFVGSVFLLPILFTLIPTIVIVSMVHNLGACGTV